VQAKYTRSLKSLWVRAAVLCGTALLTVCGFLFAGSACAQDTLHLLMAADTEADDIGDDCKSDVKRLKVFFSEDSNVPPGKQVKLTILSGPPQVGVPRFSHDAIIDYFKDLQKEPEYNRKTDSILFYYSGHGFYDPDKGHFLKTPGQMLFRSELRKAILDCKPRFAAIITDSCEQVLPAFRLVAKGAKVDLFPTVDALFFQPVGFVDINACSQAQFAVGGNPAGGFFTNAFFDLIEKPVDVLAKLASSVPGAKQDRVLTWREFFPLVAQKTNLNFKFGYANDGGCMDNPDAPGKRQCSQDPQLSSLPERTPYDPPDFKPGFAVVVLQNNGKDAGLRVTAVDPGAPAEKAGLKTDDAILRIDNKSILSAMEFTCALNFGPVPGTIVVKYDRAGTTGEAKITLERGKQ
jgi:hypothetical protein